MTPGSIRNAGCEKLHTGVSGKSYLPRSRLITAAVLVGGGAAEEFFGAVGVVDLGWVGAVGPGESAGVGDDGESSKPLAASGRESIGYSTRNANGCDRMPGLVGPGPLLPC